MQRRSTPGCWVLFSVLAALFAASCTENPESPPQIANLVRLAGDGQSAPIGSLLPLPLVVRVEDQHGAPLEGAVITFTATTGGGVVSPRTDTTDADGRAETSFRLGTTLGVHTVSATLEGLLVSFTATATAAPASRLAVIDGDGQAARVATQLPKDLTVKVLDAFDNPKPGIPVSFTVVTGGGLVSAATVPSDNAGIAKVHWTLGPAAGVQTVVAGSGTIPPVTFNAAASPADPAVLVVISGNNQIAAPSSALPDSLVVRLTDAFGNGIPGATLTWSAAAGNGTVTPAGTLTNASGRSAARWVVGPTSGTQTATSRMGSITATFNAAVQ